MISSSLRWVDAICFYCPLVKRVRRRRGTCALEVTCGRRNASEAEEAQVSYKSASHSLSQPQAVQLLGWNFTEMGEFDPSKGFQYFSGIVGGVLVCTACSQSFKQPIGKGRDVKQRSLQTILADPTVASETRAGCRLSGKQFLFRCACSGTAFYISHSSTERKQGSLYI